MDRTGPKLSLIFFKLLILQSFFYITSIYGPKGYGTQLFFIGLLVMGINYFVIKHLISFSSYLLMILIFFFTGFLQDTLLIYLGVMKMNSTFPPIWLPTLWMMFLGYYGDVFNKMLDFPIWAMSILGAIGGSLAYYRGLMSINIETHEYFYYLMGLVWAVFMPFSLKLFKFFKMKHLKLNKIRH
jgi:hypothetical protein